MKKTAKIIPVFICFVLLGLIFLNNLNIELTLPSKGWSRPINLKTDSKYPVKTFNYEQNGEYHILFPTEKETAHITVDTNFKISRQKAIPISGEISNPFWFKDGKMVYLKGNELYLYDNLETKITDGVTAFARNNNMVLFAVEKKVYRFDSMSKNYHLISSFDYPISRILISKYNEDVLVVQDEDEYKRKFTLLHNGNQVLLSDINISGSERIEDIDFDTNQTVGLVIYGIDSIVQGVRTTIPYYLPFTVDNSQKTNVTRWEVEGDFTSPPKNYNISLLDGVSVLFTAEGPTKGKKSKINVYEAKLESTQNLVSDSNRDFSVEKRSISNTTASKPFRLNEKGTAIAWFGYDGEKYSLFATTNIPYLVKKANESNNNDFKTAAFESVSNIFSAVLILFFALIWLFPPAMVYIVMFFVQGHRFESNKSWWIVPFSFLTYLTAQIYFFNSQFSKNIMILAPNYLKIQNSLIIWPTILGLASYLIYLVTKREDTNHVIGLCYTIGVDLLFVSLLIGVYIF